MEYVARIVAVVIAETHDAVGLAPGEHRMCVRQFCIKRGRTGVENGTVAGSHGGRGEQAADNQRREQSAVCFVFMFFSYGSGRTSSLRTRGL